MVACLEKRQFTKYLTRFNKPHDSSLPSGVIEQSRVRPSANKKQSQLDPMVDRQQLLYGMSVNETFALTAITAQPTVAEKGNN
jgi:hypothetical protein